jgi:hypothetical protein
LKFQKNQFVMSHDLCIHFGRLEFCALNILPINIFHRE